MKKMVCLHKNFNSTVNINRLTDIEGGPVTNFSADIQITCIDCNQKFRFIGLPMGFSYSQPTCSADGTELRMPILPPEKPIPQFSNDAYGKKAKKEWESLH